MNWYATASAFITGIAIGGLLFGSVPASKNQIWMTNARGYIGCNNGAWEIRNIDLANETFTVPADKIGLIYLDNAWCKQ